MFLFVNAVLFIVFLRVLHLITAFGQWMRAKTSMPVSWSFFQSCLQSYICSVQLIIIIQHLRVTFWIIIIVLLFNHRSGESVQLSWCWCPRECFWRIQCLYICLWADRWVIKSDMVFCPFVIFNVLYTTGVSTLRKSVQEKKQNSSRDLKIC